MKRILYFLAATAVLAAAPASAAAAAAAIPPHIAAAVADPARSAEDRSHDAARKYPQMLTFMGVQPGMVIMDYFGAHGITTEVLARAVGPGGRVLIQNPPWYYSRFGRDLLNAHIARNRLPNVVVVDAPFTEIPVPPNSLDGVVLNMIFHDLFWMEPANVPEMLRDLYTMVTPGGFVGIVDHDAPAGSRARHSDKKTGVDLHRVEGAYARRLFEDAGFVFEAESDALRNPQDDMTQTAFESPVFHGDTNRFMYRFRKPR